MKYKGGMNQTKEKERHRKLSHLGNDQKRMLTKGKAGSWWAYGNIDEKREK